MKEIRECLENDLPAVYELMAEVSRYADTGPPALKEIQATFESMNRLPGIYRNWVALEENTVIGFLSLAIYKTMLHPTGTALINELVVSPDYRGRGIAGALVDYAAEFARDKGAVEIEVGTEFENERARKFYKKAGFEKEFLLFNRKLI